MSDERLTDRPSPAPPPPAPGFRPPTPRPKGWTTAETTQAVSAACVLGVMGAIMGFVWSRGVPLGGILLGGAVGALIGGAAGVYGVLSRRPRGERVDSRDLPGAEDAPPAQRPRRAQPDLPSTGIANARSLPSFAPAPGMLRVTKLDGHQGAVNGASISPDGETAVTCGSYGTVVGWDLASGFGLWSMRGFKVGAAAVAHSPDGQLLAAAGAEEPGGRNGADLTLVHVLDARTGRPLRRIELRDSADSLAWLPDNRHLLIGCQGQVRVWEVNEPSEVTAFPVDGMFGVDNVASLAAEREGRFFIAGTSVSQDARVLTLPEGEVRVQFKGHTAGWGWVRFRVIRALAVAPDGQTALSGSNDGTARVWAIRSGEQLACFTGHAGWWGFHGVTGVAFLPGGQALSAGEDGTLRLWDVGSGKELVRWDHGRGIRCLAVRADGKLALTGAWDGSVRIWHIG